MKLDDIVFGDNAVYFPSTDTVAVSDLHVGLEEAVRRQGMSMPLGEETGLVERLGGVLDEFGPSRVVFNGDVHHSFGELGDAARTIRRLAAAVDDSGADAVFVEGNHDTMLDSVVETHDWFEDGGVVFTHGDELHVGLPDASLYVVGHDHPCVEIEMQKTDCFLYGPFDSSHVLVTPAFNPLCSGVVVNEMESDDFMTPFVRGDFGAFRVVVVNDDEVLRFPRLSEFRGML